MPWRAWLYQSLTHQPHPRPRPTLGAGSRWENGWFGGQSPPNHPFSRMYLHGAEQGFDFGTAMPWRARCLDEGNSILSCKQLSCIKTCVAACKLGCREEADDGGEESGDWKIRSCSRSWWMGRRLAALGALRGGGLVAALRRNGAHLGGQRRRLPIRRTGIGRYGAAGEPLRTGRGLDRRGDGGHPRRGAGSGDATPYTTLRGLSAWDPKQSAAAPLHDCRGPARRCPPAVHDRSQPSDRARLCPLYHLPVLDRGRHQLLPEGIGAVEAGAPALLPRRRVSLARCDRFLCTAERRCVPVLRPRRCAGGLAASGAGRALGPDRRVCGDGAAGLLCPHALRLGAGVSHWG